MLDEGGVSARDACAGGGEAGGVRGNGNRMCVNRLNFFDPGDFFSDGEGEASVESLDISESSGGMTCGLAASCSGRSGQILMSGNECSE
jgi:hypothetical protein